MTIQAINPATEEVIATYDEFTPAQVEALAAAHAAFGPGGTSLCRARRGLRAVAAALRDDKARLAGLITAEDGQADHRGRGRDREVRLELRLLRRTRRALPGLRAGAQQRPRELRRLPPLGIVLAIMPWNSPSGRCSALPPRR